MFFDPIYLIIMLVAGGIAGLASLNVRSTFGKYSKVGAQSRITGAEAARIILERKGIHDVKVVQGQGFLSDLYDPIRRVIKLSPAVYQSSSLSSIGVASHEAGHAVQHAAGYFPLHLRNTMVPVVQFSSNFAWILILAGAFTQLLGLAHLGVLLFAVVVVYQIVTLPVEFDASSRALALMTDYGIVSQQEKPYARKVLQAAALTYVAAVVTAVMQLLYFAWRTGLIGGRRD